MYLLYGADMNEHEFERMTSYLKFIFLCRLSCTRVEIP